MNLKLKKVLQAEGLLYPDIPPQGWECPKCGRVYSPTVPMCLYCGGEQTVTATSVTGGAKMEDEDKCEFCYVAQNTNLEDDDSICRDCGVGE